MNEDLPAFFDECSRWVEQGVLRALDLALARFVHHEADEHDPVVLLAVALVSERNGHGHVCLDLADTIAHPETLLASETDRAPEPDTYNALTTRLVGLDPAAWAARLGASSAICDLAATGDDGRAPLVLAGSTTQRPLLYLRRYWRYERIIEQGIEQRLARCRQPLDPKRLRPLLDTLFPAEHGDPWQRIACVLAARSPFAVITGGPGTGKTTTVVRLLALLQGLALAADRAPLRIRLAAPTGKAAARLNASIAPQVADLPVAATLRATIPTTVSTLHRLLGPLPESRRFRHHARNPLDADLVVVDEASMVDVELMAALIEALRPETALVLLGDKDQLASVEAGAVLGDLCRRAATGHYTEPTAAWISAACGQTLPPETIDTAGTPLDQAIAMLRHSYRFRAEGGIGALAQRINSEPPPSHTEIQALFARPQHHALGTIAEQRLDSPDDPALIELVVAGYSGYLSVMREAAPGADAAQAQIDAWARAVLAAHGRFQLLVALRHGPWGVSGFNARIGGWLTRAGLLDGTDHAWFAGRPVLITRNDDGLRLMNGDIGIALETPLRDAGGATRQMLRVAFPHPDGGEAIRWVLPSRLQAVETVFAMTVHKSQGSEFTHTALALPDHPTPVLTRELIYTGITRARERFTLIHQNPRVLSTALRRRVRRVSGLRLGPVAEEP
ncbi:exodeoxyribonuclease V subunit alpha [Marichromatium bheemlicum]|uniref:RecBCD enzyme subunit RecD n=1 Tax=Marichromatium bheemlicum TaxID=365339 RepID=A0ABX1I623_9GAMM|nr:exodeoxyribonuclease V subunit alpha [Marichromatium bheemlicum]NKN32504.1 exodeoxyribonuclease V subunit alpha [Marichromatium bheemlicum]